MKLFAGDDDPVFDPGHVVTIIWGDEVARRYLVMHVESGDPKTVMTCLNDPENPPHRYRPDPANPPRIVLPGEGT